MSRELTVWWLIVVFCGGAALGVVFFGGLWLTVRHLLTQSGGPLLVALSFVVRMAILLMGLLWLTHGYWLDVLVCLAGLLVARTVILGQLFGGDLRARDSKDQPVT